MSRLKPRPTTTARFTALLRRKSKEPARRRRYGRALKPFGDARSTAILLVASQNWLVASAALVEEGVDIGLWVEGDEVVDLFTGADETDWEIQFVGDGDDDAALGGAVEFGEHDSCDAGVAPEFAGLVQAVLAGGGVEDEEHVVRRARDNFRGGALHFFELGHEI